MKRCLTVFLILSVLTLLLPSALFAEAFLAAANVKSAKTPAELLSMTEQLNAGCLEAIKNKAFSYEVQDSVLQKSADSIDQAVMLHGRTPPGAEAQEKAFFLINREVLRRIIELNRKTLDDYQEKLDDMENPLAFFKSPAWRQPERLAAFASFRLGWNNYYGGLLYPGDDPEARKLFAEAVESFSRALVDAKQDSTIITSVFGRGLCYKHLKAYKEALKDFQTVKGTIKKDDVMNLRCRYEEAHIAFLRGAHDEAMRRLDDIERSCPADKLPTALKASFKELRASILNAAAQKDSKEGSAPAKSSGK